MNACNRVVFDNKERVIWEFTFGIEIDNENKIQRELQKQNFENAIYQITEDMTHITDGLTYNYCNGTWKNNKHDNIKSSIERNLSVCMSVIVLPKFSDEFYNSAKNIISDVNKTFDLGLIHIQAVKIIGTEQHFISF